MRRSDRSQKYTISKKTTRYETKIYFVIFFNDIRDKVYNRGISCIYNLGYIWIYVTRIYYQKIIKVIKHARYAINIYLVFFCYWLVRIFQICKTQICRIYGNLDQICNMSKSTCRSRCVSHFCLSNIYYKIIKFTSCVYWFCIFDFMCPYYWHKYVKSVTQITY